MSKRPRALETVTSGGGAYIPRAVSSGSSLLTGFQLNQLLVSASTPSALLDLASQHGTSSCCFNSINLSTCLHRLASRFPGPLPAASLAVLTSLSISVQHRELPTAYTAKTVSALLHSVGSLGLGDPEHLAVLSRTVGAFLASGRADPATLSSLLLCMGRLQWTPSPAHLSLATLCQLTAAAAPSMSASELPATALAAAKCGLLQAPLWGALARAALRAAPALAPQGVATLCWAFAKARVSMPEAVGLALGQRALACFKASALTPQDVAYVAYALARNSSGFGGGPLPLLPLWQCIGEYVTSPAAARLPAASALALLAALTSTEVMPEEPGAEEGEEEQQQQQQQQQLLLPCLPLLTKAAESLCRQCLALLTSSSTGWEELQGNDLGVLCTALTRGYGMSSYTDKEARAALGNALSSALQAKAEGLSWRSLGCGDAALRLLGCPSPSALASRALACVTELSASSDAHSCSPARLLAASLPSALQGSRSVLLVGRVGAGEELQAALQGMGVTVHSWQRFAGAEAAAGSAAAAAAPTPWPALSPPSQPPPSTAIIAYPTSKADWEFTLHAAASCLAPGAAILLLVCAGDRPHPCPFEASLLTAELALACPPSADGSRVLLGTLRPSAPLRLTLAQWESRCSLSSPLFTPPLHPWLTYPGLFAGGRLDVMSQALLAVLQAKGWLQRQAPGSHILDAFCGTGALAAGVHRLAPGMQLTLCDADSLALQAAAQNLPPGVGDRRLHCAHGLPPCLPPAAFSCIVSNPPVHAAGGGDDLRVLAGLLLGAPGLLAQGGALVCVAQAHVCVGALALGLARQQQAQAPQVTAVLCAGGRFIVWHIVWS